MTKRFGLPKPKIQGETITRKLPYNGTPLTEKNFSFSFTCFDRSHKLFNLGDDSSPEKVVSGRWFLDWLDCLKNVSSQTISSLRSSMYDLHPIDWKQENINTPPPPPNSEQLEYWQFRINKSRGRVIGFKIDNTFYVVWLDPHHNLTNSEGYGIAQRHFSPKSEYEMLCEERDNLKEQLRICNADLEVANKMLGF